MGEKEDVLKAMLKGGLPTVVTPTTAPSTPSPKLSPLSHKCTSCKKAVYATEKLSLGGQLFHKNCAKCRICNTVLGTHNYVVLEDGLYCEPHAKAKPETLNATKIQTSRRTGSIERMSRAELDKAFEQYEAEEGGQSLSRSPSTQSQDRPISRSASNLSETSNVSESMREEPKQSEAPKQAEVPRQGGLFKRFVQEAKEIEAKEAEAKAEEKTQEKTETPKSTDTKDRPMLWLGKKIEGSVTVVTKQKKAKA
eukprot:TRINITY_DN22456_c0_g1_i1.p1 TRINITY_DN22456_c0_g1~~TRINITY_DN22456_c0_g1_i1.p1  ORF type:complete len:252 (+),score=48.51 TRINITY_DN22456_c0_g1_i1:63-818(+)